ncbi:MAG: DUF308 domain-containing protein [Bacteroidales bacterium]|jgi:uncharacterized membrane protein HdeD (DUF308 family)|nr:DUF308 domain-containing protein [Bacteroidales bacterium]
MKVAYIIIGGLFVLLGLVMIFTPEGFVSAFVVCLGLMAIFNGVINLVSVRNMLDDADFKRAFTLRAVFNIVIGLLAVIVPIAVASVAWTVIVYILAAQLLISSFIELYGIWKMSKSGIPYGMYLFEVFISIFLAIVLFAIPATVGITLIRLIGVLIVFFGIGWVIWNLRSENKKNEITP